MRVGDAVIDDNGVTVPRHAFFGSSDPVYLRWHELKCGQRTEAIGSKTDKKAYAQMPYLQTDNVHLLEHAIRMFFKSKHGRLSQASTRSTHQLLQRRSLVGSFDGELPTETWSLGTIAPQAFKGECEIRWEFS